MKTYLSFFILSSAFFFANPANAQQTETDTLAVPPGEMVSVDTCPMRVPALSLVTPNPFRQGYLGSLSGGLTLQSRTRLSGDRFDPDGNASFNIGLGDPSRWLGISLRANIYGLAEDQGAADNFGEGTFDLHFSRQVTKSFWVGGGGYDLTGWKREIPNQLTSIYIVATKTISLSSGENKLPLYLTAGVGNGRFRRDEKFDVEEGGGLDFFGSLAVPILPKANLIFEYTGYNAFSGISFFPFDDLPAQLVIGVDDIFNEKWSFIFAGSMSLNWRRKGCWRSHGWVPPPPPQPSRT